MDFFYPELWNHSVLLFSRTGHTLALSYRAPVISGLHPAMFLDFLFHVLEAWTFIPSLSQRPGHSSRCWAGYIQLLWIFKDITVYRLLKPFQVELEGVGGSLALFLHHLSEVRVLEANFTIVLFWVVLSFWE